MIGIFDSGIGGLTVVKEVFRQLPDYRVVYFGDTARTPYGTKSPETITKYALQDAKFLVEQGAKVIVIACHTASSVAADEIKKQIPIPVFEVVSPAIAKAKQITKHKRLGIIGTRATINSEIYQDRLNQGDSGLVIKTQACPLFVSLVEEGWLDKSETKTIAKKYLFPLKREKVDTLILACTHYPLIREVIQQKIGKKVMIVDPAVEVVAKMREFLKHQPEIEHQLIRDADHKFFFSDVVDKTQYIVREWLERPIKVEKHSLE
ncbi:glutamate racemase [Patescibacteria group bacterium]|nr:glutamate racemase [Patescibacteria group bacterium]MBU1890234.1 glutamate racemase [Patescibacteria group bacterium]